MYAVGEASVNYPMGKRFHSIHKSNLDNIMAEGLETVKQIIHGSDWLELLLQREAFYIVLL